MLLMLLMLPVTVLMLVCAIAVRHCSVVIVTEVVGLGMSAHYIPRGDIRSCCCHYGCYISCISSCTRIILPTHNLLRLICFSAVFKLGLLQRWLSWCCAVYRQHLQM